MKCVGGGQLGVPTGQLDIGVPSQTTTKLLVINSYKSVLL